MEYTSCLRMSDSFCLPADDVRYEWLDVTGVNDKIFEKEEYVLSLGYLLCMAICIPFGVGLLLGSLLTR